ncbi:MAG: nucleotidyltransferase family protein [Acidobacteria bacterium]|nr:nucleotidyltransferase family protein [Acidobacteriota bacterium]
MRDPGPVPLITQIILAAGFSSRMQQPKPLLDFCGLPLLSVLLEESRRSLVDAILVVLGHARDEILGRVSFTGATVVINKDYRTGQTGSLQCALRALNPGTRAFINLPVDHPLVTHREIDALVRAYRCRSGNQKIFVPVFRNQPGRPILFDLCLRGKILALAPDTPARTVLESRSQWVCPVPVENPHTMKDMDTPEEYRECLSIFHSLQATRPAEL